jgi:hypothetical protein
MFCAVIFVAARASCMLLGVFCCMSFFVFFPPAGRALKKDFLCGQTKRCEQFFERTGGSEPYSGDTLRSPAAAAKSLDLAEPLYVTTGSVFGRGLQCRQCKTLDCLEICSGQSGGNTRKVMVIQTHRATALTHTCPRTRRVAPEIEHLEQSFRVDPSNRQLRTWRFAIPLQSNVPKRLQHEPRFQ